MNKQHIILGLGETGLSFARYLSQHGFEFSVMDSRDEPPGLDYFKSHYPNSPCLVGGFDEAIIAEAHTLYLSPGIDTTQSLFESARQKGVRFKGDAELFVANAQAPVIGITGTNGKSTVTAWLNHIGTFSKKRVVMGGNIGIPALALLEAATPDFYILELSSFQLELAEALSLYVACITNVSDDHLDRHGELTHYLDAKHAIFEGARQVVYNRDNARTFPRETHFGEASFGLKHEDSNYTVIEKNNRPFLAREGEALFPVDELKLAGKQNWENALAVIAIADMMHLEDEAIFEGLRTFSGLPHRCQLVRQLGGVSWVNDSKGTNVGATIAAIEGMAPMNQKRLILIAGGQGKGADFNPLANTVKQHCGPVFLFGEDATKIATTLGEYDVKPVLVGDLNQAVHEAYEAAESGDIVLFSPACASFDMFRNFELRGQHFEEEVQKLGLNES